MDYKNKIYTMLYDVQFDVQFDQMQQLKLYNFQTLLE